MSQMGSWSNNDREWGDLRIISFFEVSLHDILSMLKDILVNVGPNRGIEDGLCGNSIILSVNRGMIC